MKADNTKGRYEWRVDEIQYPYKPALLRARREAGRRWPRPRALMTTPVRPATRDHGPSVASGGRPLIDGRE